MVNKYRHTDASSWFQLGKAANLWAGHDPIDCPVTPIGVASDDEGTAAAVMTLSGIPVPPLGASDIFQVLKEKIAACDLPAPSGENITMYTRVPRDALETLARKMNNEDPVGWPLPAFLFHETRAPKRRRTSGEPKSETIDKWRKHHDELEHFRKIRGQGITLKAAAELASLNLDAPASTIERDRRRYQQYLAAKRQNKN